MGNVPNLRFPEFSGEWKKCTLGDITINFNLRNKEKIELPMYSVTNNRGFIPQSEQFEDRDMVGEDIKAYKIIHNKDFAYNPARINVGSIAKYNGSKPCMISSLYVCFKATDGIDEDWLMHLLRSPKIQYYYNINGEGGVRIYLFYPNFARIRTSFPTIAEQRKIANLLSLLDARITTQNKIIEKLQSLIKGLAVALTTKEKANIAISQCLECHSSTLQESEVLSSGLCKVFGANGLVGYKDVPQMNGDAILVIKDGSGVGTVSYAQGKFSVIGTLCYLTVIGNNDLRYLYFALSVFNFQPYKTGMAIPHIYFKDYGKAKIYCPSLAEQKRVANVLDKLESKLFVEQELLASFNQQKLYLLGKMFI